MKHTITLLAILLGPSLAASSIDFGSPDTTVQLPGPVTSMQSLDTQLNVSFEGLVQQFPGTAVGFNAQGTLAGIGGYVNPAYTIIWAPAAGEWTPSNTAPAPLSLPYPLQQPLPLPPQPLS